MEVCVPQNYNVGLLAYSPLAGGSLTGKYLNPEASASGRFNLFPGYMGRYNKSLARVSSSFFILLVHYSFLLLLLIHSFSRMLYLFSLSSYLEPFSMGHPVKMFFLKSFLN
jgi:hypothetical protein